MATKRAFERLLEMYPVTMDGEPPAKALRTQISLELQRPLYDHWLKEQKKLRAQHVAGEYFNNLTVSKVKMVCVRC